MGGQASENDVVEAVRKCLDAEVLHLEALAPGLGSRRFYRVTLSCETPRQLIARVDDREDPSLRPQGVSPEPALEPIRSFLERSGLPVPKSWGRDVARGVELLEDLGSDSLERVVSRAAGPERRTLYTEACQLIPRLQRLSASPREIPAFGRRLDRGLFRYKAEQLVDWGLPGVSGRSARTAEARIVQEAFASIDEECLDAPQRLAHRDFKAANLHVLPQAAAGQRLAMIDLQGAFLAPPEYDLVCLLRDSHVELPEDEVTRHLDAVRPQLPDAPDSDVYLRRFHLLTLSRVAKDLSRYMYAARERSDRRYLRFVPPALRALRRAASALASGDPRLDRLSDLLLSLPEPPCER